MFIVISIYAQNMIQVLSKMIRNIIIFILLFPPIHSFKSVANDDTEYIRLLKLEHKALKNSAGYVNLYDLTGRKDCNKTRIKYLGIIHTNKGKSYKILTSFFVFRTAASCHGTSRIKIFDLQNRFIGEYNVGMPEALPDFLKDNKLVFSKTLDNCNPRRRLSINFRNGLPKILRIPCSKTEGDIAGFSNGN